MRHAKENGVWVVGVDFSGFVTSCILMSTISGEQRRKGEEIILV